MAVGPETQVHEIEHDRSAGDLPQRRRVLLARHLDVCGLHGHRMDLLGTQRTMREQALSHMSEIPLRVSVWRHSPSPIIPSCTPLTGSFTTHVFDASKML